MTSIEIIRRTTEFFNLSSPFEREVAADWILQQEHDGGEIAIELMAAAVRKDIFISELSHSSGYEYGTKTMLYQYSLNSLGGGDGNGHGVGYGIMSGSGNGRGRGYDHKYMAGIRYGYGNGGGDGNGYGHGHINNDKHRVKFGHGNGITGGGNGNGTGRAIIHNNHIPRQAAIPNITEQPIKIGCYVVCHSNNTGVYFGQLKSQDGTVVALNNASILWRWNNTNTIFDIALRGVWHTHTCLSEQVSEIMITDVCTIIACTQIAIDNLSCPRWDNRL